MTTTRSLSFSSLRALAASRRHDLAGNWSNRTDRDLSRTATDLLATAYDDGEWADHLIKATATTISAPVDLHARRARSSRGATPKTPRPAERHARAS
ncbi:hypothetical protein GCM10027053_12650 [Intrasporangium mesophilum]